MGWQARVVWWVLLGVAMFAACVGLVVLGYVIEPHWVAKDDQRFLTTARVVDRHGNAVGRRHEVRGHFLADGTLLVSRRRFLRTRSTVYRVRGKEPDPPRGRRRYTLEPIPVDVMGDHLELRVPASSRITARLDSLVRSPEEA